MNSFLSLLALLLLILAWLAAQSEKSAYRLSATILLMLSFILFEWQMLNHLKDGNYWLVVLMCAGMIALMTIALEEMHNSFDLFKNKKK